MRRILSAADGVVIGYYALITLPVAALWGRLSNPSFFLLLHALVVAAVGLVAWSESRFGGRFWRFVHSWIIVFVLLAAFRELHFLIRQVHPYGDLRWDLALEALDRKWFGDVGGFFARHRSRAMADVFMFCYCSYFFQPLLAGAVVYARGRFREFREMAAVLMTGWFLSYLGYFAVPALGPHVTSEAARAPELEGHLWAGSLYRLLKALELEMPDAFPSGHTLATVLTLCLAWRHARRVFWILLPFAVGLVISTMYLRYHYVVDVLAGLALVPVSYVLGRLIHRAWEGEGEYPVSSSQ